MPSNRLAFAEPASGMDIPSNAADLLSQVDRPFRVATALGPDHLVLKGFSGTESISRLFRFQLDLISTDADIDTEALLRTDVSVSIRLPDEAERELHGKISSITQIGRRSGVTSYRAEMVPWFWFLGLNRDSRIFQGKTVPQIVKKVFADRGESDFELRLTGEYPKIDYCVQYRESDRQFIQRLLEREGVFYFFRHDGTKHTMVIGDHNKVFNPTPHHPLLRFQDDEAADAEVVQSFRREHSVHVGKVTLDDYDPLQSKLDFTTTLSGSEQQEFYDYPGGFAKLFCEEPGPVLAQSERYTRLRLDLEELGREESRGHGNCRGMLVGHTFTLAEHFRKSANREHLVTSVTHVAKGPDVKAGDDGPAQYTCTFTTIPSDRRFRPEQRTARPIVSGTQTAVVVGPKGEEVWTDTLGRVKCRFHWDREGKKDEDRSCWIRVASPWAGKGWGVVSIPRIGNEVVVAFLEGDPDRPIIVGSVHNDVQGHPFTPVPSEALTMGIKSRSSKGGGGFNEITVTDTKGSEQVTIRAERDRSETVKRNATQSVGGSRSSSVDGADTLSVGGKRKIAVGGDQESLVKGSRTDTVGINSAEVVGVAKELTVGSHYQVTVVGDMHEQVISAKTEKVGSNKKEIVASDKKVEIGKDLWVSVGGDLKRSVEGRSDFHVTESHVVWAQDALSLTAGTDVSAFAGGDATLIADGNTYVSGTEISIKATDKIELVCGNSTIELTPTSISIRSPLVTIN